MKRDVTLAGGIQTLSRIVYHRGFPTELPESCDGHLIPAVNLSVPPTVKWLCKHCSSIFTTSANWIDHEY